MGTSYIRPSGLGDYTKWSDWAADGARAPGDVGIQDEAGTQTDTIVLPALAGLEMHVTEDVRVEHNTNIPLIINAAMTGLVVEAAAGKTFSFVQTGGGVMEAVTFGAGSGFDLTRCYIEGASTAMSGAACSGAVRIRNSHIKATVGTGLACSQLQDVQIIDSVIEGPAFGLHCNTWAGKLERTLLKGVYPWGPFAAYVGWCGDADMLACDLQCTDTASGGVWTFLVDLFSIPAGKTVRLYHVNLTGTTAYALANDGGLWLDQTNAPVGTLVVRNCQIVGFGAPWRTTWTPDGHDYCNAFGAPLNGITPSADAYPNKTWVLGAHDLSVDPLFVDAGTGDYRLDIGSPCLGAGVDVGVVFDRLGVPFASPPPIGAYAQAAIPPKVLPAGTPVDATHTQITFDLPMLEDAAFLSTASYSGGTLTPVGPGVPATVTAVTPLYTGPDLLGALLTHGETTGGGAYTCAVTGVQSAVGAGVDLGNNTAAWSGVGDYPTVSGCVQDDSTTVRVQFSEAMGDVGDPTDYSIVCAMLGAEVTLQTVTQASPSEATLHVTPAFFPGVTYEIRAAGAAIVDEALNPVDPTANTTSFVAVGAFAQLRGYYIVPGATVTLGGHR